MVNQFNNYKNKITMSVLVQNLQVNDKIKLKNNTVVKIKSISNGFYLNSKILTYSNGLWSCFLNTDKVNTVN